MDEGKHLLLQQHVANARKTGQNAPIGAANKATPPSTTTTKTAGVGKTASVGKTRTVASRIDTGRKSAARATRTVASRTDSGVSSARGRTVASRTDSGRTSSSSCSAKRTATTTARTTTRTTTRTGPRETKASLLRSRSASRTRTTAAPVSVVKATPGTAAAAATAAATPLREVKKHLGFATPAASQSERSTPSSSARRRATQQSTHAAAVAARPTTTTAAAGGSKHELLMANTALLQWALVNSRAASTFAAQQKDAAAVLHAVWQSLEAEEAELAERALGLRLKQHVLLLEDVLAKVSQGSTADTAQVIHGLGTFPAHHAKLTAAVKDILHNMPASGVRADMALVQQSLAQCERLLDQIAAIPGLDMSKFISLSGALASSSKAASQLRRGGTDARELLLAAKAREGEERSLRVALLQTAMA